MNTQYLVTVKDGRLGKARQIRPFKVEYIGRPGNIDELAAVAARAIARFVGTKQVEIVTEFPANTATIYADVFCNKSNTPVGRVKFDQIITQEEAA